MLFVIANDLLVDRYIESMNVAILLWTSNKMLKYEKNLYIFDGNTKNKNNNVKERESIVIYIEQKFIIQNYTNINKL